jgi:plasmid maintenance system antidote protein VapI/predicted RNase H-like HicB family nuclease
MIEFIRYEIDKRDHSPNALVGVYLENGKEHRKFLTSMASALGKKQGDQLIEVFKHCLEAQLPKNTIVIKVEKTKDGYTAFADNVKGIYGGGGTIDEVKESINDAIRLLLQHNTQENIPHQLKINYALEYKWMEDGDIDYDNTKQLMQDLWLFLAQKPKLGIAKISEKDFYSEAGLMIEAVRAHERNKILNSLSVMSPEQFQQFLDYKRKQDELELLQAPNATIQETLGYLKMPVNLFASEMCMTIDEAKDLIFGKISITENYAIALEKVLKIDRQFWMNLEHNYRTKLSELTNRQP